MPRAETTDCQRRRKRRIDRWCRLGILFSCMAIAVCVVVRYRHTEVPIGLRLPASPVEVTIDLSSGMPEVEAWANGRGPYVFLLDSGCGNIHVSEKLAEALALPRTGLKGAYANAVGKTLECPTVRVQSIRLGEAEFVNCEALVRPFAPRGRVKAGPGQDGILGYCLFRNCLLTIDSPAGQLVIQKGELGPVDGQDVLGLVAGQSVPKIRLDLGREHVEVYIDSGNNGAFSLAAEIAGRLSLSQTRVKVQARIAGGARLLERARLKGTVRIGRHVISEPTVDYAEQMAATVGMGVLRHFAVTFDGVNGRVRFSRASSEPITIPGTRSIAILMGTRKGVRTVLRIDRRHLGEGLDVRLGDTVLAMNGRPIEEFDQESFQALFDACDVVELELMRGRRRFRVTVPVVELP